MWTGKGQPMEIAIIIILVAIGVAVFLKSRSDSTKSPKKTHRSKTKKSSSSNKPVTAASKTFTAVTIVPGPSACEAVLSFGDRRFLSGDAPILPLTDCGSPSCTCKYVHYEDRRDVSDDRRQPFSMRTDLHTTTGGEEKRQRAGRRGPDKV